MRRNHPIAFVLGILVAALLACNASAALVTDQEQASFDATLGNWAVGGASQQKIAQSVTAGMNGPLAAVELPIACSSGTLIVEIVALDAAGRPTSRVLGSASVPAADLPPVTPPEFRRISFRPPIPMSAGDRFAIVLRNPTGSCALNRCPPGDPYPGGESFFDARPNPPGWISHKETGEPSDDIPFRTLIDVPDRRREEVPCTIEGFGSIPEVSAFAPLCRCLQDPFIREQRCTLLHPSLFLIRRIPMPLPPGPFKVQWTVVPLTKMDGAIEVTDLLPQGFQTSLKRPLVFFPGQVLPGAALTMEYEAMAGGKAGSLPFETRIRISSGQWQDEGRMGSRVQVSPPPR
jgi:hypothetical protein